ncbi:hypothetical protein PY092_16630 [Muricauda sp. 334s03]|jgi:hypothetical protein|uniref:Uncharacterized protein n=1 Tax=Flagellimonas yonaguniensis TaxID=3031325 RepID=A0ABT5Y2W0_9FLAO|nr:hypothetical protein [[Muricauda] yonaguniensis]MDF0717791.1 hypothetical protein [[Muricauda] yonaguniensis]
MGIGLGQPKYDAFIRNEIKTLGFISNQSSFANSFSDLTSKAYISHSTLKGAVKKPKEISIDLECELELLVEQRRRRVFIGVNISPNYSMASYMIAICESNGDSKDLIRKFHFDFAMPKKNEDPKPVYHIQYGGEQSPLLAKESISCEILKPKISSPRLVGYPTNLALLLDSVFCEFRSEITEKIIASDEWRNLIKENEDLLLKPYFTSVRDFLSSEKHSSDRLLRDFYYGG